MEAPSFSYAIAAIIVLVLVMIPLRQILHKAGFSGWWALLVFLPLGNIIGLWLFARADWPNLKRG